VEGAAADRQEAAAAAVTPEEAAVASTKAASTASDLNLENHSAYVHPSWNLFFSCTQPI
jgi:hypothetical protein